MSTIEPGRTAYEARFAGETNWPADGWDRLPEDARAIWRRVEEACRAPRPESSLATAPVPADALVKRVPSLAQYLGEDVRGDGFEQWIAAQLDLSAEGMAEEHGLWLRLARTFGVACVEQMNREAERDPSPEAVGRALAMWSRVAGFITITAIASVSKESASYRRLARLLAEEFKIGAKLAADTLENQEAGG